MKNPKWYYLCDLRTKQAIDLTQIPDQWENVTGMGTMPDEELATMAISGRTDRGFLTQQAALAAGIDEVSMNDIRTACLPFVVDQVRAQRDVLLALSDVATASDRWSKTDSVSVRKISAYRQALRDITQQDPFAIVWPRIPTQLDFIRNAAWPVDVAKSIELQKTLDEPPPEETLVELQNDQWDRIQEIRDTRMLGGILVDDYWFYTDTETLVKYLALVVAGDRIQPNLRWKTMTKEFVTMTAPLVLKIYDTAMRVSDIIYQYGETMKERVYAADNPMEIDVTIGWPTVYADVAQV